MGKQKNPAPAKKSLLGQDFSHPAVPPGLVHPEDTPTLRILFLCRLLFTKCPAPSPILESPSLSFCSPSEVHSIFLFCRVSTRPGSLLKKNKRIYYSSSSVFLIVAQGSSAVKSRFSLRTRISGKRGFFPQPPHQFAQMTAVRPTAAAKQSQPKLPVQSSHLPGQILHLIQPMGRKGAFSKHSGSDGPLFSILQYLPADIGKGLLLPLFRQHAKQFFQQGIGLRVD